MIIDTRSEAEYPKPSDVDVDVVVAGAGIAGTICAWDLAQRGYRVVLLEAGGPQFDAEQQALYEGTVVSNNYPPLDLVRLRQLGGTSNHWSGLCRPFSPIDFKPRPELDLPNWPISLDDLQRYETRAKGALDIEKRPFDTDGPFALSGSGFDNILFPGSPPTRFGPKFAPRIAPLDNLFLYLHSPLVAIERDGEGRVSFIINDGQGRRQRFRGKRHVLALGTIENARMLLASPQQPGNRHGHVGRYFMEHPHLEIGHYIATDRRPLEETRFIEPQEALLRDLSVLNASIRLIPYPARQDSLFRSICRGAESLHHRLAEIIEVCGPQILDGRIELVLEQQPNRESRVTVDHRNSDALGLPRVELDWRFGENEYRSARAIGIAWGVEMALRGIGRMRLAEGFSDELGALPQPIGTGPHQMGTTRMAASDRDGVVDADLKVFDTENLYVAGASVFVRSGHANPTFPLTQLTLRLVDHLDRSLS
ncbi:GMC family oxidoreductase [Gammaproteobacteria bacterium]|nr:GMC family oxidoreductase [Gammaproteobacteria bacterium]